MHLTRELDASPFLEIILGYNPAGQVRTRTTTNAMYNWSEVDAVNRPYASDALNQTTSSGPQALAWSAAGTLASDGARGLVYGYDALNRLTSAGAPGGSAPATLAYDPLDRLRRTTGANGGAVTQFRYDGDEVLTEHDGSGAVLKNYVWGPGVDEPMVIYSGTGVRHWPIADERGSIIALANDGGGAASVNAYDEYGVPSSTNTGQTWLPEVGLYHYKARAYSPHLGRFLQPDPIGYGDGLNLYNYVHADPVNRSDPSGLMGDPVAGHICQEEAGWFLACGHLLPRIEPAPATLDFNQSPTFSVDPPMGMPQSAPSVAEVTVVANRLSKFHDQVADDLALIFNVKGSSRFGRSGSACTLALHALAQTWSIETPGISCSLLLRSRLAIARGQRRDRSSFIPTS